MFMVFGRVEAAMTRSFRITLLGFGIVAGLVLLAELAAPILAISSDTLESSRARSEQITQKKADAMVAEILQRPLFTQGRQAPQVMVAKAAPPQLQGRLAGVMLQDEFREALFTRPGGKPLAVREGDMIDGWTVERIATDSVLLTSAFGEQLVRPTNGSADEIAAPAQRGGLKKVIPGAQPVASAVGDPWLGSINGSMNGPMNEIAVAAPQGGPQKLSPDAQSPPSPTQPPRVGISPNARLFARVLSQARPPGP
jgi:hypothetical protein